MEFVQYSVFCKQNSYEISRYDTHCYEKESVQVLNDWAGADEVKINHYAKLEWDRQESNWKIFPGFSLQGHTWFMNKWSGIQGTQLTIYNPR